MDCTVQHNGWLTAFASATEEMDPGDWPTLKRIPRSDNLRVCRVRGSKIIQKFDMIRI